MINLKELDDFLESEEGKKAMDKFIEKLEIEKKIKDRQLKRFKEKGGLKQFTEKVIDKYNSDEYKNRWYKRGIMPPESLSWFLFEYAEEYGRECTDKEWAEYGNMFTTSLFFIEGYYFNKMDGQGSIIKIIKSE